MCTSASYICLTLTVTPAANWGSFTMVSTKDVVKQNSPPRTHQWQTLYAIDVCAGADQVASAGILEALAQGSFP